MSSCLLAGPNVTAAAADLDLVLRELRALRRAVDALAAGRTTTPAARDAATLERLLPAIHDRIGDATFCVVDLAAVAALPDAAALAAELAPIAGAGGGLRRIGRLLARGAGCEFRGFRLTRVGDSRDGCVWQVTETRATRASVATLPRPAQPRRIATTSR